MVPPPLIEGKQHLKRLSLYSIICLQRNSLRITIVWRKYDESVLLQEITGSHLLWSVRLLNSLLTAFFLYSVRYCQFFLIFARKVEDKRHFGHKKWQSSFYSALSLLIFVTKIIYQGHCYEVQINLYDCMSGDRSLHLLALPETPTAPQDYTQSRKHLYRSSRPTVTLPGCLPAFRADSDKSGNQRHRMAILLRIQLSGFADLGILHRLTSTAPVAWIWVIYW